MDFDRLRSMRKESAYADNVRTYCNRTRGNRFEALVGMYLRKKYGFWVYNCARSMDGTPADLIVTHGGMTTLIDCKSCANDTFPLSRIEPNQHYAMRRWLDTGQGDCWFAVGLADGTTFMHPYAGLMDMADEGVKRLDEKGIRRGTPISEWAEKFIERSGRNACYRGQCDNGDGGGRCACGADKGNADVPEPGVHEEEADGILDGEHPEND